MFSPTWIHTRRSCRQGHNYIDLQLVKDFSLCMIPQHVTCEDPSFLMFMLGIQLHQSP